MLGCSTEVRIESKQNPFRIFSVQTRRRRDMLVHHFEGLSQRRSQWKGNDHCQLNLTVIGFIPGMPRVFRSRPHYTLLN